MVQFVQDMPPEGGYAPITYKRVPPKTLLSPLGKVVAFTLYTIGSFWWYYKQKDKIVNDQIEEKCSNIALTPMLKAEADRMYLKQVKKNRELEQKIMKDVEGWEVGKWQGLPVYATLKPDEYIKVINEEYYAHCDRRAKSEFQAISNKF